MDILIEKKVKENTKILNEFVRDFYRKGIPMEEFISKNQDKLVRLGFKEEDHTFFLQIFKE